MDSINQIFKDATPNIPKVSEFSNVSHYKHWKKVVEIIRYYYEVPDKTLISIVNIRISGNVAKKFNSREFETVKEMWDYMDEEFGHDKGSTRPDDLHALLHPPASVKDIKGYIEHFEGHLSKLNGFFESEEEQVVLFMLPLSSVLVNAMTTQDLQTLSAAKRIAIALGTIVTNDIFSDEVRMLQSINKQQRGSTKNRYLNNVNSSSKQATSYNDQSYNKSDNTVACYYCNKRDHYTIDCRMKQNKDQRYNKSNRQFKRRNHRSMNGKSQRSTPSSF